MKASHTLILFAIAIFTAVAVDWLLYAIGAGTMHVIGEYKGRGWMANMTFPGFSFIGGLLGLVAAPIWGMVEKRIRFVAAAVAFILYVAAFMPLCHLWFCSPRFHDSKTDPTPGWILKNGER
jgi:hypothetical protein